MEFIGFGIVALIFISIFFISGVINERNTFRLYKERLQKEYGAENKREWKDEEFCHIGGYFKKHKEEYQLDEITWNDLNMDDIFKQIDYAKSSAGDEYLYYLLRTPEVMQKDWTDFE